MAVTAKAEPAFRHFPPAKRAFGAACASAGTTTYVRMIRPPPGVQESGPLRAARIIGKAHQSMRSAFPMNARRSFDG